MAFEEVRVEDLDDPIEDLRAVTGGPAATPTITIGDETKIGFDPDWIRERLGLDEA